MDLPRSLPFVDYSGIDLNDDRLVVVSQESSALWVGSIEHRREGKREHWRVLDDGHVFMFPRGANGETLYCNVEGVSWIDKRTVVVVSDEAKDEQEDNCRIKDQSIHVFGIPAE